MNLKFEISQKKMVKLKPILQSLKEKKRYLVYEVISENEKDSNKDRSSEILKKVTNFLGVFESAKAGIQSVEYNKKKQRGVLRVSTKQLDKLRTSLAMVNQLNDEEVMIRTIGVSGILKKARTKYVAG